MDDFVYSKTDDFVYSKTGDFVDASTRDFIDANMGDFVYANTGDFPFAMIPFVRQIPAEHLWTFWLFPKSQHKHVLPVPAG